MSIAAHQLKAAKDLAELHLFRWDTRAEAQNYVEEQLSLKADKPVVKDSSIRSDHCAKYKCEDCDTFKIRIKARKRKEDTKFLVDPKASCWEHIKFNYEENGVFLIRFARGFIYSNDRKI
jgi:hypothetical protein